MDVSISACSLLPGHRKGGGKSIRLSAKYRNNKERVFNNSTRHEICAKDELASMTEIIFKILVIGDPEVGKTSLVQRYVDDIYPRKYKETLGADFAVKVIHWSETETVRLQFWDIAGQERFHSMTRVYYRKASACIVMFDVTKPQTFHNTIKWKNDLDSKCFLPNGLPIPCMLAANKIDQPREVLKEDINKLCKEYSFLGWTEMSVRDDKHVTETMDYLIQELMSPLQSHGGDSCLPETGQYISLSSDDNDNCKNGCCVFP